MRGLTGTVLATALTLALAGCASDGAGGGGDAPETAVLKMDAVQTMDGATVDIDAALDRGETVALVFWQVWCAPCKREAPAIAQAQKDHGSKIRFIGVVPGKPETVDDGEVGETAKAWGYGFPQVRDSDLSLTRGLGVRGTPTIIVLGKDRTVLYDAHRAPEDWTALEGEPASADSLTPFGDAAECEDGVCPLPAEGESP